MYTSACFLRRQSGFDSCFVGSFVETNFLHWTTSEERTFYYRDAAYSFVGGKSLSIVFILCEKASVLFLGEMSSVLFLFWGNKSLQFFLFFWKKISLVLLFFWKKIPSLLSFLGKTKTAASAAVFILFYWKILSISASSLLLCGWSFRRCIWSYTRLAHSCSSSRGCHSPWYR